MAKTVDSKKHKRSAYFSKDKSDKKPQRQATEENERTYNSAWDYEFENPEQYVEAKLIMLQNEMYINPTPEEILHLKELKTQGDIDRAVHTIIDRHWSN